MADRLFFGSWPEAPWKKDEDAEQISEAGKDDEGGSAQPKVRQKGGHPSEGSQGVHGSGHEGQRQDATLSSTEK